jgi:peptidoglycan/LPS O-acetylase OafA/YrhL
MTAREHYRPEIQGLRAVAALLVAAYHIWLGRVSGGVDVFFVVTGFLITRTLLGHLERSGRIDFATFWANLARRLLPAALLVLSVVVVAGLLWLPTIHWARTIKEVIASASYVENWYLAVNKYDYLERDSFASPVQHFWAMSLQGQVYILWPILLALTGFAARRMGLDVRRAVGGMLLLLFVASLTYSVVTTRLNQPFAYFDTLARLWEISIGGLLALVPPGWKMPRRARLPLGWIGLLAILTCGLLLPVSRVFPGYAALWPTLAVALIILAGSSGSAFGADRLLSIKPLASLGDVSYGIYLWHWPLFVFYRTLTGSAEIGLLAGLAIIGLTIILAWLTTRYVENPIRNPQRGKGNPVWAIGVGAGAIAGLLALAIGWGLVYLHAKRADQVHIAEDDPRYPGARALEPGFSRAGPPNARLYPGPLAVRDDLPDVYADGCQSSEWGEDFFSCTYGRQGARTTIALVGGSHSTHWLPALQVLAERHDWRITTYLKDMCRFALAPASKYGEAYPGCDRWKARVLARLKSDPPAVLFTTATYGGDGIEIVPDGFTRMWHKLGESGVQVVAVRDTPYLNFAVAECVEVFGPEAARCSRPRDTMLAKQNPAERLADLPPNVHLVDLSDYFCDATTCFPAAGNLLIYRDDNHITATYMRTLAPMLERALAGVLPMREQPQSPLTLAAETALSPD